MAQEGKYIYCIIQTNEERNFGPMGIGDRRDEVCSICYRDLSVVISSSPMTKYVISRENLISHEKVIETVMKDYTVLPVRFCTIAASAQEIRELLRKRYVEFINLLRDMDNKVELGVKALWKNIDQIFQEIKKENKDIITIKKKALKSSSVSHNNAINIGKIVQSALKKKKEKEGRELLQVLQKNCYDLKKNKIYGDKMILNAAFLVDRARAKEFDHRIDDLSEKYAQRIDFKYVGPAPPYNFVNIVVKW